MPRTARCRTLVACAGVASAIALAVCAAGVIPGPAWGPSPATASADTGGEIRYTTVFQDPEDISRWRSSLPWQDFSLEEHAIGLIDATPERQRITFAFRDYNSMPVTEALLRAAKRGVVVDGVIDGGEAGRPAVKALVNGYQRPGGEFLPGLGPQHAVVCGAPDFNWYSCIANSLGKSLMHNKFLTFSSLADGREHVVLQTSENFYGPTQYRYYNDMVEIDGDHALYDTYVKYFQALKTQVRSDTFFLREPDGPNTIFTSPRWQGPGPEPDRTVDDTIVDRMNEIDCSEGGSIRVAQMAFRTERAVIVSKLLELKRAGCDIEIVVSNADGPILAPLVSAGIPVHAFYVARKAATATQPARSAYFVHDKFWLVDAKSTVTGRRTKIAYAGSSNWRGDQQYSDDLLLRMLDDGVYDAYLSYWRLIRARAESLQDAWSGGAETTLPVSVGTATEAPNAAAGWNRSVVTLRIAASDGHNVSQSGLKRLHVEMTGAQNGSWDLLGEENGYRVGDFVVSAEGTTTVTYHAEDNAGNVEPDHTIDVRIDKTAPRIDGLPRDDCRLWPPNGQLERVATVTAADPPSTTGEGSGVTGFEVSGDPADVAALDEVITQAADGATVDLRRHKGPFGTSRTYAIRATASDVAGNTASATASCVVPHSQGSRPK
jgi:phosphatidylserine/phosphatidylglycerophosphate/cardiolipin synthase-like enzyme